MDLFLVNGRETNSRKTSVARRQILDKVAARERLGKHVRATTNRRATVEVLMNDGALSALPTALRVVGGNEK
jgi:hypothetical protein